MPFNLRLAGVEPVALVVDDHFQAAPGRVDRHVHRVAARIPAGVEHGLLRDAVGVGFHQLGEARAARVVVHFDAGTVGVAVEVGLRAQGGAQSQVVQGERAQLHRKVLQVAHAAGKFRRGAVGQVLHRGGVGREGNLADHHRHAQQLLADLVVQTARDAAPFLFLGPVHLHEGDVVDAVVVAFHRPRRVERGEVERFGRAHRIPADAARKRGDQRVEHVGVGGGDRPERAQKRPVHGAVLPQGQGAETVQVLGEDDGVAGILARVELQVDVG